MRQLSEDTARTKIRRATEGLVKRTLKKFGFDITRAPARKLGFEIKRTPRTVWDVQRHIVNTRAPVVFDVGANVGQTALRYRALFREATIHCFEPFPQSFQALSSRLSTDFLVKRYMVALSSSSGVAKLNVNRCAPTNSLLPSDKRASNYWGANVYDTEDQLDVETDTVDGFCERQGIAHIDILKIDVQGSEYAVLSGATQMLTRQLIDLVYMEVITGPAYVGQHKLHEYLAFFDSLNYELFDLFSPVRCNHRLIQFDCVFVSSKCLQRYERFPA